MYEGKIHFFGGSKTFLDGTWLDPEEIDNFSRQHFIIETKRTGKIVKMIQEKDLEVEFYSPSCSNFRSTYAFPFFEKTVVIICDDDVKGELLDRNSYKTMN